MNDAPRRTFRPSTRRISQALVVVVLAVAAFLGYNHFLSASVDGKALWSTDDASAQLGPGGWVHVVSEDDEVLRNVVTGEEHSVGTALIDHILPDGRFLSAGLESLEIHTVTGKTVAEVPTKQIGAGVDSVSDLSPGEDLAILGASEKTVVVMTCYAPQPSDVDSEVAGGHAVIAGIRLSDGTPAWARDTGSGCDGFDVYDRPKAVIGTLTHVAVHEQDQVKVVRIDDGDVRAQWSPRPEREYVIQGDLALHVSGRTATVTDLAHERVLTRTRCQDAATTWPGNSTHQLSPEATLGVRCGTDEVRILDPSTDEFTTVEGEPVMAMMDREADHSMPRIPDGGSIVYDRYVLSRSGTTVTISDALSGKETGSFTAPQEMALDPDPRGRVLHVSVTVDEDDLETRHMAVDLRTGDVLVADSSNLSNGSQVDPSGFLLLSGQGREQRSGGRYGGDTETETGQWVFGVRDARGES